MTSKMVANFRRSLSFPNQPSTSSTKLPKKAYHVRSTSLPCRSHPLISQLKDEINELKSWASSSKPAEHNVRTSAWLCGGLSQLKNVQESLDDLLQLPQTRESLCGHNAFAEKFLDDFLRFLDVYGIFQSLFLTLKEQHSDAKAAVRRRDDSKMALYSKNLRKMAKDVGHLAASIQSMGRNQTLLSPPVAEEDAEIVEVIKDVVEVTASVSVALFNGISVSLAFQKPSCLGFALMNNNSKKSVGIEGGIQEFQEIGWESLWGLRKKSQEELKLTSKRMHELEDCIGGIEIGSERVFRSLINTRVSLLNVLTH